MSFRQSDLLIQHGFPAEVLPADSHREVEVVPVVDSRVVVEEIGDVVGVDEVIRRERRPTVESASAF